MNLKTWWRDTSVTRLTWGWLPSSSKPGLTAKLLVTAGFDLMAVFDEDERGRLGTAQDF
jgi:hypothetical protein